MSNDIYVVAEHSRGELAETTFELLAVGREVATATGGRLVGVLMGSGAEGLAKQMGVADGVLYAEHEALAGFVPQAQVMVLTDILRERSPRITLLSGSAMGMDMAAPLSVGLNLPLVAYARAIAVEGDTTVVTSQLYGGKAFVETEFTGAGLVSVMTGVFDPNEGRSDAVPSVERLSPATDLGDLAVSFRELVEMVQEDIDVTREEVLVGVGRGVEREDNVPIMEELAQALGGVLCATRPAIDQGWLPATRQVGKSGVKVKPRLYVAAGVSGAPEHVEGMKDAELIVAINTDPTAPIFGVAHYGVVGDLLDIVPLLTERVRAAKRG